jgi:hypothetical protein
MSLNHQGAATMPAATTTKQPAARKPAGDTSIDHLQEAMHELDQARTSAQGELRETIDDARKRIGEAIDDLRDRAGEMRDWDRALERASEHLRTEFGVRAVRAQRTPEALTEMSTAIRKRRAELAKR